MPKSFEQCYKDVQGFGVPEKTRFGDAKFLRNQQVGLHPYTFPYRKGGNAAIGLIEGLQFIAGTNSIEAIQAAAPHARLELFGANSFYGPKCVGQFERVIAELTAYRNSRRATVMIAHPTDTSETLPCTTSMQFQLSRARELYTTVNMRSCDLVWGLPYDTIQFTMVAHAVAECLQAHLANIVVHIGNVHIYRESEVNIEQFETREFTMMHDVLGAWHEWQSWAEGFVDSQYGSKELFDFFGVRK
jgi:hypothetical protein